MKKFNTLFVLLAFAFAMTANQSYAQIHEPEGLNMPGEWNGWTNPPANLALASYTQVPGGQVTKITNGTDARWTTTLEVGASGDITAGAIEWLFTSGNAGSPWNNKWTDVSVSLNTIQEYIWHNDGNGSNNTITVADGKWYVVNFEDIGYANTRAIFMEVSAEPVDIVSVSVPASPMPNTAYNIDVTVSANPSVEEVFYLRYTTDNWLTSDAVDVAMTGTNGIAVIPGQAANTQVDYYVFSSSVSGITSDFSLYTMRFNNNGGANYSYTIGNPPPPSIVWCNLQWPENGDIEEGQSFNVYGQVYLNGVTDQVGQGVGMQAWIGWSDTDSDPSTWSNWELAVFNVDAGNNDEFMADLGSAVGQAGTYYYAMRYQYQGQSYVYGGYQGGFWDGTNNVSGVLNVANAVPLSNWSFAIIGILLLTFVLVKFRK